jgi:hypothetical protein
MTNGPRKNGTDRTHWIGVVATYRRRAPFEVYSIRSAGGRGCAAVTPIDNWFELDLTFDSGRGILGSRYSTVTGVKED